MKMKFFPVITTSLVGLALSSTVSALGCPAPPPPPPTQTASPNNYEAAAAKPVPPKPSVQPLLPWPTPPKPYCNSKCVPIVRKSWRKLSDSEKSQYIAAVKCLKKAKTVSGLAGAKGMFDDFQGIHSVQTPNIHWVGHFILWHRYFLAVYENALRKQCGYAGAQPYWDWETDNASGLDMDDWPIFDSKTGFGGNGPYQDGANPFNIPNRSGGGCVPDGPFASPAFTVNIGPGTSTTYNPHCLARDFSRTLMGWGNQTGINWVWDTPNYGWFARRIENIPDFTVPNIHGSGHFGVGGALGTMGDAYNSPGDPIFFLHHANLDRVFWQWQWQPKNLPHSLSDVSGPIIPFDYTNKQGGNVTTTFQVNIGGLAGNVTLLDLLNTQSTTLCYTYAAP
ncbi:hypothetical protein TWF694_003682 [Orbilia ellipsospora]|uniref:Tyrosinase copper-binding domain-containing protein n=1 Tax=Orbilia ellipsospora TaxID=2528407 RepID=A0AAV9WYY8_9PEZI